MAQTAQAAIPEQSTQHIEPIKLTVCYGKTTHLLFPYNIKSVDRGSRDLLAQKAKGVENILQVKAGKEDFSETNLSVITAEGKLYSFVVQYAKNPSELNLVFGKEVVTPSMPALFADSTHVVQWQGHADWVGVQPSMHLHKRDNHFGMQLQLKGLYIADDVFYFQLALQNNTNITYDIELLRFFIKDRKQSKRTASQEVVQESLLVSGNAKVIEANKEQTIVIAMPKFTIPDQKELIVQVMERQGGRHLRLRFGNRTIVQAETIPATR